MKTRFRLSTSLRMAGVMTSLLLFGASASGLLLSTASAKAEAQKQLYTCPMHPQVKSEHPGDCPICHMALVPIEKNEPDEAKVTPAEVRTVAPNDNESVEGRASFKLTPLQAGNLQFKTVVVESKALTQKLKAPSRVLDDSTIAIQISESDASKVKSGQKFLFKSLASSVEFHGKITAVDSALDPMSRTVRVTGALTGRSGLRSESSGTVAIEVVLGEGLFVPENAVIQTGNEDLVYVALNNRISPRKIQLGAHVDGGFQVFSGVKEGEVISAGPNFLLDSEARIRVLHD